MALVTVSYVTGIKVVQQHLQSMQERQMVLLFEQFDLS